MGDRGNIVIRHPGGERVYLYTHERGSRIEDIVRVALRRAQGARWDDEVYFARIVFCAMVEGDERGATGFGISPTRVWSERDELHVDCARGVITRVAAHPVGQAALEVPLEEWSFGEFLELTGRRTLSSAGTPPPWPDGLPAAR